jgi:hypothetical protein
MLYTYNRATVHEYLHVKGEFVSPTQIGKYFKRNSSWASRACLGLVKMGMVKRNAQGWYKSIKPIQHGGVEDLLAVIHRDGGHHTAAVGIKQSCRDAEKLVLSWRRAYEALDLRGPDDDAIAQVYRWRRVYNAFAYLHKTVEDEQ